MGDASLSSSIFYGQVYGFVVRGISLNALKRICKKETHKRIPNFPIASQQSFQDLNLKIDE